MVDVSRGRQVLSYINGGDGCIKWIEDNIYTPIFPEGSLYAVWVPMNKLPEIYKPLWDAQKKILREALALGPDGTLKNRLVILCWPRGEGKSFLACLIQLWRFFCFTKQQICLGANSKDQTKFVHFDIMRDIILNSPVLRKAVGLKNLLDRNIRLRDNNNRVVSEIRTISTAQGIVSNITGYTFSEMFDMKNPKFFQQLDGSTRAVPNALGVIDSTVSGSEHILRRMFDKYVEDQGRDYADRKDKTLFFSYRCSKLGLQEDYWNPHTTQTQLDSFRSRMLPNEFERYFLNLWSAGGSRLFTDAQIESLEYLCNKEDLYNHELLMETLARVRNTQRQLASFNEFVEVHNQEDRQVVKVAEHSSKRLIKLHDSLLSLNEYFVINSGFFVDPKIIYDLSKLYKTSWAVLVGLDRADPTASVMGARTVVSVLLKGLPESKGLHFEQNAFRQTKYMYIMIHLGPLKSSSLDELKEATLQIGELFGGIDSLAVDHWAMFDYEVWCKGQGIPCELIRNTVERQRDMFNEFFLALRDGRFKVPQVNILGSRTPDIFREELGMFDYNEEGKKWGSPEKRLRAGIQDDTVFATGYAMYGGRSLTADQFRLGSHESGGGVSYFNPEATDLYGRY